jgi:hypothetical protein
VKAWQFDVGRLAIMRHIQVFLFSVLSLLVLVSQLAFAAQQKKIKAAPPPKPIYEAPMRVVVVRNSSPTCEPDCPKWISAEGEITAASPAAFRRVFKQVGAKNLPLVIRSPGGSINAAIEIGNMIRKRNMTVAVGYTVYRSCRPDETGCKLPKEAKGIYTGSISEYDAFCNSACPMLLAAGTTRLASSVAYVGLHQPKTEWSREWLRWRDTYRMVNGKKKILKRTIISRKIIKGKTTYGLDKPLRKKMGNYYKSMGIDLAVLDEMMRAKYQDMYWLPTNGRDKLKLRTSAASAAALANVPASSSAVGGIDSCNINGATYVGEICKTAKARVVVAAATVSPGPSKRKKPLLDPAGLTLRVFEAKLADGRCGNTCPHWIAVEGLIAPDTPRVFEALAKRLGRVRTTVVFNSLGGDIRAAIQLAQIIRKMNYATAVGKTWPEAGSASNISAAKSAIDTDAICRDACVLAYAGGSTRYVNEDTGLVVQNPLELARGYGDLNLAVFMNKHFGDMGIGPQVMAAIALKPANQTTKFLPLETMVSRLANFDMAVNDYLTWKRCDADTSVAGCSEQSKGMSDKPAASIITKPIGPEMTVRLARLNNAGCAQHCPSWFVLDGRITIATPALLEGFAKKLGRKHATVVLNSPGGDVDAAIQLGRMIRSLGFDTAIGKTVPAKGNTEKSDTFEASSPGFGFCRGSCLMAYVGGKHRHIDGAGNFQIQEPFSDLDMQTSDAQEQRMERHLNYMGADSAFFTYARSWDATTRGVTASRLLWDRVATDAKDTAVLFDWKRGDIGDQ